VVTVVAGRHDHELRAGDGEHRGALACGETIVHAGGDRAELGQRDVAREVLDARRQHEPHHVTFADTAGGQPGGDFVGDTIEVRVRQWPITRGDVGHRVSEAVRGFA